MKLLTIAFLFSAAAFAGDMGKGGLRACLDKEIKLNSNGLSMIDAILRSKDTNVLTHSEREFIIQIFNRCYVVPLG